MMKSMVAAAGVGAARAGDEDEHQQEEHELDQTREIPALSDESEKAPGKVPSAAPQQVIPIEETVPVQSCIERTLLHEVLRQQSAEEDEDPDRDG